MSENEKRQALIALLTSHDWHYERSDSARMYNHGYDERCRIYDLVRQVSDGPALYDTYRQKAFPGGT